MLIKSIILIFLCRFTRTSEKTILNLLVLQKSRFPPKFFYKIDFGSEFDHTAAVSSVDLEFVLSPTSQKNVKILFPSPSTTSGATTLCRETFELTAFRQAIHRLGLLRYSVGQLRQRTQLKGKYHCTYA